MTSLGEDSTTWLQAIPVAVVALLVVLVPGGIAARLLGVRGWPSLAVAPGVSVTTISINGVAASLLGISWGTLPLLAGTLLVWLVAAGIGFALRSADQPDPGRSLAVLVGLVVAAIGVLVVYLPLSQAPDVFPQHPDTIFHLGTSQWMIERGDISSLVGAGYVTLTEDGFYPAAFHGAVATVAQLTGAPVVVSASVVAVTISAVVWPLGCIVLARLVLGPGPAVTLAAAVTSVGFSAFPYWLMGYGVLWPNLLGYALLPAALACLVAALAPGQDRAVSPVRAVFLGLATLPGLGLAHPNAFIAFLVLGYLVVAERLASFAWRERLTRPRLAVWAGGVLFVGTAIAAAAAAAITQRADALKGSNIFGPEVSVGDAVIQTVLHGPRGSPRLYVLGAVVLAGVVVLLWRHRDQFWVPGAVLVTSTLFILVMGVDTRLTRLVTWPWYNNPPRLAALLVLPATLAAAAALAALADLLSRIRGVKSGAWWPALMGPTVLVLVTGGYVEQHRSIINPYFRPSAAGSVVSETELDSLRVLARDIPRDAVVAANPWNGGPYLYLVSGRRMLFPTEKAIVPGDRAVLAKRLDQAGVRPEVCAAAARQGVRYAITGGQPSGGGHKRYRGVDRVSSSPAFEQIESAGPYMLYRLSRCADS